MTCIWQVVLIGRTRVWWVGDADDRGSSRAQLFHLNAVPLRISGSRGLISPPASSRGLKDLPPRVLLWEKKQSDKIAYP